MYPTLTIELPTWIGRAVPDPDHRFRTLEERMALAIRLAEHNIDAGGGPFGAAVFEIDSGRLVAPGVNMVLPLRCSLAHAEAIAIVMAQAVCHSHDLGAEHLPPMELVTSAQPCIQCYGNVWWSGLRRLVIGATKHDVESITGFAEGPLPDNWSAQLENRSPLPPIQVVHNVLRNEAQAVLKRYRDTGGLIYNPGASSSTTGG